MMNILCIAKEKFFVNISRQGFEHTRNPHNFTPFAEILGLNLTHPMRFLFDMDNKKIVTIHDLVWKNHGKLAAFRSPGLILLDPVGFAKSEQRTDNYYLELLNVIPHSMVIAEPLMQYQAETIKNSNRFLQAISEKVKKRSK